MKYTKSFNLVDNFFYLIFLILPLSLVIGPAPVNISLFISSIGLFVVSYKDNNWIWLKNKIFILFSIFILYIFLNYLFINYQNLSGLKLFKILGFFRFIFVAFFIAAIFHRINDKKKSFFIKINFFLICFILIDILIQKIFGRDLFGFTGGMCFGNDYSYFDIKTFKVTQIQNSIYCQRFAGPFDQELIAGSFIVFIGTIIFAIKYLKKPLAKKDLFYFLFGLLSCFVIVLITGDRSPFISLLIAMFIFFLFEKNTRKYLFRIFFIFSIFTITTIAFNGHVYERYISVAKGLLEKRMVNETRVFDDNLVEKREYPKTIKDLSILKKKFYDTHWGAHYLTALEMFKEKPFIGYGYHSFRQECKRFHYISSHSVKNRCSTHPHNYIIQLLAETGIIGLILYLLFIMSIFIKSVKIKKIFNEPQLIFLIPLFFSFIFPIKPGGSIFSSVSNFYLFYILGWIIYFINYNDIRIKNK